MSASFFTIDLPAALTGALACIVCGLLGNFLILRRQALVGDAISHVVLPGIVVAFLITGAMSPGPVMLGALAAAILAVGLIEAVRRLGGLEPGAAMGVVFTIMFAAGIVLIEQHELGGAHISADHVLYGNLEGAIWIGPLSWADVLNPEFWPALPRPLVTLLAVTALIAALIALFFKELKVTTFDPGLAAALGFAPRTVGFMLMFLTALAAVAAFEAVGSILVIAMFICPAAAARMLTDNLAAQIWLSVAVSVLAALSGYVLAAFGPFWVGAENSLNAAGMIAVTAGLLQLLAMLFAPRYGAVARLLTRRREARAGAPA
jgi:manganese/zinc/iron transport system permease protein